MPPDSSIYMLCLSAGGKLGHLDSLFDSSVIFFYAYCAEQLASLCLVRLFYSGMHVKEIFFISISCMLRIKDKI